ncbi:MAG: hypothetical protein CL748_05295 [Chloroflexi bacterium]|nr:hypothetical protein [Chloroflexota bacterium]
MTKQFGFVAFLAAIIFMIVATFGYVYAWRKKNLDWVYNER